MYSFHLRTELPRWQKKCYKLVSWLENLPCLEDWDEKNSVFGVESG